MGGAIHLLNKINNIELREEGKNNLDKRGRHRPNAPFICLQSKELKKSFGSKLHGKCGNRKPILTFVQKKEEVNNNNKKKTNKLNRNLAKRRWAGTRDSTNATGRSSEVSPGNVDSLPLLFCSRGRRGGGVISDVPLPPPFLWAWDK